MFQKLSNILLILLISLKLFPSRFLFSQSSENYLSNYIFFKILYNKQFSILLKYYDLRKFLRGKEKINHLRKKCERRCQQLFISTMRQGIITRSQKSAYLRKRLISIGACTMINEHRNVSDVITVWPIRDISCIRDVFSRSTAL